MSMPDFTPQQIDKLSRAIARDFEYQDFVTVLGRYPGREDAASCLPDGKTRDVLASSCLNAIRQEGTLVPFLSRVVEHKWKNETLRSAVFAHARSLVRPSPGADQHVRTIVDALAALVAVLAGNAPAGQCPGSWTCVFVRTQKADMATIVASLQQFDALKSLHDSLHVLQVQGAGWLDEGDTDTAADMPPDMILAIVGHVRDAAASVRDLVPEDARAICERCRDTAADAASRMASGVDDDTAFAQAQLRMLVAHEMPAIDEAMFTLSRDLPVRALRAMLESGVRIGGALGARMEAATAALDRLSEVWRANILEHALWQATDARLHIVAEILDDPTGGFLVPLFEQWTAVRQNLQVLIDTPPGGSPIDAPLNAAIVLYERALPTPGKPTPPGPSPADRLVELLTAFDEFRLKAGVQFLAVDRTLKAVFTNLLPLGASLQALIDHVPTFCTCPTPPP